MSVSDNETIKKLDEQIAQLQARKKTIENRERAKAKKAHTKLLFQFGEIAEKYSKCKTPQELEDFFKKFC